MVYKNFHIRLARISASYDMTPAQESEGGGAKLLSSSQIRASRLSYALLENLLEARAVLNDVDFYSAVIHIIIHKPAWILPLPAVCIS